MALIHYLLTSCLVPFVIKSHQCHIHIHMPKSLPSHAQKSILYKHRCARFQQRHLCSYLLPTMSVSPTSRHGLGCEKKFSRFAERSHESATSRPPKLPRIPRTLITLNQMRSPQPLHIAHLTKILHLGLRGRRLPRRIRHRSQGRRTQRRT